MEFDRFHMKNGLEAILIFSYYSFFFFLDEWIVHKVD